MKAPPLNGLGATNRDDVRPPGNPTGANQHTKDEESGKLPDSYVTQPQRATNNGIGERTQRKLDRIARDHPQLHDRVKSGELSINAAAVSAGIVKPTVSIPLDPARAGRLLTKHFTPAQFNELARAYHQTLQENPNGHRG